MKTEEFTDAAIKEIKNSLKEMKLSKGESIVDVAKELGVKL